MGQFPINHSSCQKTKMNDFSCSIRIWTQVSFVLLQCRRLTDRQTDGLTEMALQYRALHYVQSRGKKWKFLSITAANARVGLEFIGRMCRLVQWVVGAAGSRTTRINRVLCVRCDVHTDKCAPGNS